MKYRDRPIHKSVYLSEEEWEQIQIKMMEGGSASFSAYCRNMLLHGEVKYYDFTVLKELTAHIGKISGNINQIAKHCNSSGFVGQDDYQELLKNYQKLKSYCKEQLIKKLRKI